LREPLKKPIPPLRVAVDTGGTFTDCVWADPASAALRMLKVFSTPDDPSKAIADAVAQIGHPGALLLLHATTVGTNTLLQRKGARVAFVTTKGFEDSIQIGRQTRPKLYDLSVDAIPALVPDDLRFSVSERTDKDGKVLHELNVEELQQLAAAIRKQNPEAIALSLLFCFANPANEQAVAAALRSLGIPISAGHRILPEFREYERASTVVVNAYLQPMMQKYLQALGTRIEKHAANSQVFVMQSSGGLTSLSTAAAEPVRTVLSGPAGGVVGAVAVAKQLRVAKIIGFDMGGTSTDVCLVDGTVSTTNEAEVAGLPVRVPMLNIHTVGAGGGSLARFDSAGALRVGPESAGANPGPICYGRGTQPTVTDANVLLGRLPPDRFLGGSFQLDLERTRRLTRQWLQKSGSRYSLEQFAEGVVRVVNANMEKALRVVSIEKGYDPRDFALIAFGGAGALHACDLAAELEIPSVVVPAMPGALSAIGILASDVVKDFSRTILLSVADALPQTPLKNEFKKLEALALAEFKAEKWEGKVRIHRSLDMRYKGQGFELSIPFAANSLALFHVEHQRRYGYSTPGKPVEVVTARLRAWISSKSRLGAAARPQSAAKRRIPQAESGEAIFSGKKVRLKLYEREMLRPGIAFAGPALVTEYSATTVVPPGWKARVDNRGNLTLESAKHRKS
jgi:N-methylhydantoinase A